MIRWALVAAGVSGLLAVVLGAFGAHALTGVLDADARAVYDTAGRYHLVHSLALAAGALAPAAGARRGWCTAACGAWLAGMVVFSGSLYLLAITGAAWPGAVAPVGGIALIAGWGALALAAVLSRAPGATR